MLKYLINNKFIIWIVDDRIENQIMISNSFMPINKHIILIRLNSCREFYKAVNKCKNYNRPHFIFMDYFMGEQYGTDLVEHLLDKRHLIGHPIIIGHSSNLQASEEIVRIGGDFVLEKIKGNQRSLHIEKHFNSKEALIKIINTRKLI